MFPDAEEQIITYLAPLLGVPVSSVVPDPRPSSFVRVMRTGNTRLNVAIRRVQMTVECWDETGESAAERLADAAERMLTDWETVPQGSRGWVGGPVPQRDPESGCTRYVMTVLMIQHTT